MPRGGWREGRGYCPLAVARATSRWRSATSSLAPERSAEFVEDRASGQGGRGGGAWLGEGRRRRRGDAARAPGDDHQVAVIEGQAGEGVEGAAAADGHAAKPGGVIGDLDLGAAAVEFGHDQVGDRIGTAAAGGDVDRLDVCSRPLAGRGLDQPADAPEPRPVGRPAAIAEIAAAILDGDEGPRPSHRRRRRRPWRIRRRCDAGRER